MPQPGKAMHRCVPQIKHTPYFSQHGLRLTAWGCISTCTVITQASDMRSDMQALGQDAFLKSTAQRHVLDQVSQA
jgi:hypothetical protein